MLNLLPPARTAEYYRGLALSTRATQAIRTTTELRLHHGTHGWIVDATDDADQLLAGLAAGGCSVVDFLAR